MGVEIWIDDSDVAKIVRDLLRKSLTSTFAPWSEDSKKIQGVIDEITYQLRQSGDDFYE